MDPDNHLPVDYRRRRELLGELQGRIDAARGKLPRLAAALLANVL